MISFTQISCYTVFSFHQNLIEATSLHFLAIWYMPLMHMQHTNIKHVQTPITLHCTYSMLYLLTPLTLAIQQYVFGRLKLTSLPIVAF